MGLFHGRPAGSRLIQIDRTISIEDHFSIYSRFFLAADKFKGFLGKSTQELKSLNFKTILRHEYNLSIRYMNHTIRMSRIPANVSKALHVPRGTRGYC